MQWQLPHLTNDCTNQLLDGLDFCVRIRMLRLSEGLILHVRQHEIVWKYIYEYTAEPREQNFGSQGRAEVWRHNFTSLRMKAWWKYGKRGLQIFGNQGRVEMRKRNFTSLEDQAEMSCAES